MICALCSVGSFSVLQNFFVSCFQFCCASCFAARHGVVCNSMQITGPLCLVLCFVFFSLLYYTHGVLCTLPCRKIINHERGGCSPKLPEKMARGHGPLLVAGVCMMLCFVPHHIGRAFFMLVPCMLLFPPVCCA